MKRILVVDDDHGAVQALQVLLELDGYSVDALESSTVALERLTSEQYAAVVTDLEMPLVNGVDVVRAAKRNWPATRVVVVSAYAHSPAADKAISEGADRVLGKPLDYDALLGELARAP